MYKNTFSLQVRLFFHDADLSPIFLSFPQIATMKLYIPIITIFEKKSKCMNGKIFIFFYRVMFYPESETAASNAAPYGIQASSKQTLGL